MFITQFLVGLVFATFGFLIVRFTPWIVQNVSSIGWAERHLALGGSYFIYRLVGLLILFGGLLYAIGLLDDAVRMVFGPILGLFGL